MGKMALITVLGLSLTVGIVGYSLNRSKTGTVENVTGFQKYTIARNIAHTAVNMVLRALDRNDSTLLATKRMTRNFMGGSASVTLSFPDPLKLDTLDLFASAKFMDTTKIMALRLRRKAVPFPFFNEAVGLRFDDADFRMSGNPYIDGRNHDMNGILLPPSPDDLPGVGVINSTDSTTVAGYGSKINGSQDVKVDTGMSDPTEYVDEYISAADRVYTAGVYGSNMTWGSPAAPEIIFADGSGGKVKFTGTIEGWGLMVVKGDIEIRGNFRFHGVVIGYNDVLLEKDTTVFSAGTPDIIGAYLMGGASGSRFEMRGNAKISYSKEAVEMAKYINKLQVYRVVRWYE